MYRRKGRAIFLAVPARIDDGPLLILLGQRLFRKNNKVTGAEIMRGMRASGLRIPRADNILKKNEEKGLVAIDGRGRAATYTLTEAGAAHAEKLAALLVRLAD